MWSLKNFQFPISPFYQSNMALPDQTVFLFRAVSPGSDQGGSVNAPPNLKGGEKDVRIPNP